ncbi:MAG: hypothetical protein WBC44_09745 [Planctomycetaceae bacterium]
MATVQRPAERYVEFDEYIDLQLDKARNGIKWTDILAAVAGVAALVTGYLVAFVAADHWFFDGGVPRSLRIVALGVVAVVALLWIGTKVVWPYLRQVNDLYAARMLEDSEPDLRGSLFGLVDLRRASHAPADEVRRALEKRAATVLSDIDVDASLDRRPLLRTSYALLAIVLVACIYAVASPKRVGPSLVRALFPTSTAGVATRTEIVEIKPGDVSVLAGAQLDVSAMIRGETPERVVLFYSTRDRRFADEPVELRLHDETTREYRAALIGDAGRGLTQDLTYRIEANDDAAGPFTVTVEQPPVATVTSIMLQHPPYTGLEPAERDTPPIDAIEGTTVTLAATANRPLKSAKLVFADDERFLARGEEVPMRVAADGVTLTANWMLAIRTDGTSPTHYRIDCRDTAGKTNPNPAVYPIAIRPDQPPEVILHDPKSDLERPANAIIPLLVSARDPDFELRELTLRLERQGQELPERTVLWEGAQAEAKFRHDWELAPLGLKPGDVVTFYVQARDNREPEFNRRNTPKLNVTITEPVAKEQVEEQLAEDRERQQQELAEAERNAAARDRESQSAAADSDPMPPNESKDEPAGEKGERPESPEAGEVGEPGETAEPTKGKGDEQADSKVNNDGRADDVALRELLEHQRKQNDEPQNDEPQNDEPQNDEPQNDEPQNDEPQNDEPQNDEPQKGESQKGESQKGESQKGESEPQQDGTNNGNGQKQASDRQEQSTGEASRQTPGEQTGKAGNDAHDAAEKGGGNSRREGGKANERTPADGQPTEKPGSESEAPGEESSSAVEEEGGSATSPRQEMTGRDGDRATGAAETPGTADDSADRAEKPTTESPAGSEPATGEQSPASRNDGTGEAKTASQPEEGGTATDGTKPKTEEPSTTPRESGNSPQPGADAGPMGDQPKSGDVESGMNSDETGEKPMASESGTGQPNADGTPSQQPSQSDTGTQPGGTQPSEETSPKDRNSQPGDSPAQNEEGNETGEPGTANQPRNEKPAEAGSESQSGEGKSGEGKSGEGKSGEGKSGEGNGGKGQPGQGKAAGGGQAGNGGGGGTASGAAGAGGGNAKAVAEEANAAYTRQATDLALKKLEDELERGEVDPELLNELGWTDDDMRRFADRLRKNLAEPTGDETPQQIAERKEFEHMLENLQIETGPAARTGPTGRVEDVGDVNTVNPLVPSEYRDAYEAFTRSVAGRREAADTKK